MSGKEGEIDQNLVRALAHPLRVEILRMLEEGLSGPKRIADRLSESLGNVSYHFRVLDECGCLELVETIPARGAVEHIYKLTLQGTIGSSRWKSVPPALRTSFVGNALAGFTERAIEALEAGTTESRQESGITWLPLVVDEQGWKEMGQVLGKVEERFRNVAENSAERMENPTDGLPVIVAVAAFELARRGPADRPDG